MPITLELTHAQQAWIAAAIARGEFKSEAEAARELVDFGINGLEAHTLDEDDPAEIARIKTLLDDAEAQYERGEFITAEESKARMAAQLASFRR
jgi:Arc/MetJ-type ribon-helix-helix transcriptional regulator